ncbi:MAG: EAL domain-containing protein [Ahrensia sp.]
MLQGQDSAEEMHICWASLSDASVGVIDTIEHLVEGVYRASLDGRHVYANKALIKMIGYDSFDEISEAIRSIATQWYVDSNRRDEFRQLLDEYGYIENFTSEIFRHKTNERIWISENARLVRDQNTGEPLYYEGSVTEVTDRVHRRRQASLFDKLARNLPGGLFQMEVRKDKRVYVPYVSPGFCEFVDIPIVQTIDDARAYFERIHPDDREIYNASMRKSAQQLSEWRVEFRLYDSNEKLRWATLLATPEQFDDGIRWHGYMFNTTERKRQEEEIHKLAYYDTLTGLINRKCMTDQIDRTMRDIVGKQHFGAVLFIDLDNFKTLNDSFGHDYGDSLLTQVAARLRHVVPPNGHVARFGGDEFVVLLDNAGDNQAEAEQNASSLAQTLCTTIAQPVILAGHMHQSTCSIGVRLFSETESSVVDILATADTAMYDAKRKGKNTFEVYNDDIHNLRARRYALLQDLNRALESNQFSLMLQPQVDRQGRIVGAEALARWTHPDYGMVSPGEFIPILEKSGHILDFTFWSLREAFGILERWRNHQATASFNLSLNLSPHCISQSALWQRMEEMLQASNGLGKHLTLELTESAAASNLEIVKCRMESIKRYGVEFAIDDFGTGFSAFANLKHLAFDELKIDNAFVADVVENKVDQQLVKAVVETARALNMRVVAEFVETDVQEEMLRSLSCDLFQGYRYSPAVPEDRFMALVDVMGGNHNNNTVDKRIA